MLFSILIVAVVSIVQSVFGVGVLLFGTPLLLLCGMDFFETLWTLLPASLAINLLQLYLDKGIQWTEGRTFALWTLPYIIIGLVFKEYWHLPIKEPVAFLLFICAGARLSERLSARIRDTLYRNTRITFVCMGLLHGLTNMGGSLLSIYASGMFTEKIIIRQYIALGYALFAITQMATLTITGVYSYATSGPLYAAVGGSVYLLIGRQVFSSINHQAFSFLLSLFMVLCGAVLLWSALA